VISLAQMDERLTALEGILALDAHAFEEERQPAAVKEIGRFR
jgi:hypothetical protein